MSKTVTLRSGPELMDDIRAAIAENDAAEKVLCCSPKLARYIIRQIGTQPQEIRKQLGADLLILGYLEDRRIIVTDAETAQKLGK